MERSGGLNCALGNFRWLQYRPSPGNSKAGHTVTLSTVAARAHPTLLGKFHTLGGILFLIGQQKGVLNVPGGYVQEMWEDHVGGVRSARRSGHARSAERTEMPWARERCSGQERFFLSSVLGSVTQPSDHGPRLYPFHGSTPFHEHDNMTTPAGDVTIQGTKNEHRTHHHWIR